MIQRAENLYRKIGFYPKDTDSHLIRTGREELLNFMCYLNYTPCVEEARQEFMRHFANFSK